jgi:hypothetical protein
MTECETNIEHATQRMRAHDATLRAVRVSFAAVDKVAVMQFLRAFDCTRAPIAEMCLCSIPASQCRSLMFALMTRHAALRVFRLCCYGGRESVLEALPRLLCEQRGLQRIVVCGTCLSDAWIQDFRAYFSPSAEQQAVLGAIGQFAARTLREMLAPAVYCARSRECACRNVNCKI